MSVVIRRRKSKPKTWSTTVMWLIFGVAAIFFLVIYGQQLLQEHSLKEKISLQRAENVAVQDGNTRLKASLLYFQSDKYIEQRAREDLNLRRDDEVVLIPIKSAQTSVTSSVSGSPGSVQIESKSPREPSTTANWLGWLNLFSPPVSTP